MRQKDAGNSAEKDKWALRWVCLQGNEKVESVDVFLKCEQEYTCSMRDLLWSSWEAALSEANVNSFVNRLALPRP